MPDVQLFPRCAACATDLIDTAQAAAILVLWRGGVRRVSAYCAACWPAVAKLKKPTFKKTHEKARTQYV